MLRGDGGRLGGDGRTARQAARRGELQACRRSWWQTKRWWVGERDGAGGGSMGGGAVVMFGVWKGQFSSEDWAGRVGRAPSTRSESQQPANSSSSDSQQQSKGRWQGFLRGKPTGASREGTSGSSALDEQRSGSYAIVCLFASWGGEGSRLSLGLPYHIFFLLSSMLECGHAVFLLLTCSCLVATRRTVSRATYIPSPSPRSFNCQPPVVVTDLQTAAWTA